MGGCVGGSVGGSVGGCVGGSVGGCVGGSVGGCVGGSVGWSVGTSGVGTPVTGSVAAAMDVQAARTASRSRQAVNPLQAARPAR